MENRRPPRTNSSDRKPYFGRGRDAQPYRSDGQTRGNSQASGSGQANRSRGGKPQQQGSRSPDMRSRDGRPDGRFRRDDNNKRFGQGKFDKRKGDNNRRPAAARPASTEPEIKITSDSQITDGRFRGRTLFNSVSPSATHTNRKLREAVFKIISRRVKGGRILDLGAGSGTIGIEAISRGAMLATFVERSARMCTYIRKNLAEMGVKDGHGEVIEIEILPFLKRAALRKRLWDVIYFDLPQSDEHGIILDGLSNGYAIKSRGLLIIEHTSECSHPENIKQLKRWRTIDQGEKVLSIYERM